MTPLPVNDVLPFPDETEGYLPEEALCLVCNLTFNRALSECPTCKEIRA